jgi:gas vesicle protein
VGLVPLLESVIKLKLISVHEYAKKYIRTNPEETIADVKKTLKTAVKRKQDGATCTICGQPIWAVG